MNRRQFFGLLASIASVLVLPAKEVEAEGMSIKKLWKFDNAFKGEPVVYGRTPFSVTVFFHKNGPKWHYAGCTPEIKQS